MFFIHFVPLECSQRGDLFEVKRRVVGQYFIALVSHKQSKGIFGSSSLLGRHILLSGVASSEKSTHFLVKLDSFLAFVDELVPEIGVFGAVGLAFSDVFAAELGELLEGAG